MSKPDPTLVRTSVQIKYGSSDRYRLEFDARGGKGTAHARTGQPIAPEHALLAGLEELARITALFGFEDEALNAFNKARGRVAEWKAARAKPTP
jgi:hypothetical protein